MAEKYCDLEFSIWSINTYAGSLIGNTVLLANDRLGPEDPLRNRLLVGIVPSLGMHFNVSLGERSGVELSHEKLLHVGFHLAMGEHPLWLAFVDD